MIWISCEESKIENESDVCEILSLSLVGSANGDYSGVSVNGSENGVQYPSQ